MNFLKKTDGKPPQGAVNVAIESAPAATLRNLIHLR
jgi:hypothetical protein